MWVRGKTQALNGEKEVSHKSIKKKERKEHLETPFQK